MITLWKSITHQNISIKAGQMFSYKNIRCKYYKHKPYYDNLFDTIFYTLSPIVGLMKNFKQSLRKYSSMVFVYTKWTYRTPERLHHQCKKPILFIFRCKNSFKKLKVIWSKLGVPRDIIRYDTVSWLNLSTRKVLVFSPII